MEKTALLKVAEEAFYASQLEKDADYRKIPFVKTFMGSVGEGTMDMWRRQYHWASRATTQEANKFYNKLTEAGKKATGEGYTAINGTQHILRSMHSIDGPRIPYNPQQGGMPLPMPKQASYSGLELAKLAMSTRLVREIQKGGVKVNSTSLRDSLAKRYGDVNKQHDPLADKLYNAINQGKVDPKGMSKQRFEDLRIDASPASDTAHRSLGMTVGSGYEGTARMVLTHNNGPAVRKTFHRPLSNVEDRFNHMKENPDIYPKMYGYRKDQPIGVSTGTVNGKPVVESHPKETMLMEYIDGKDLRGMPKQDQKKGFQQIGDKLKNKGFKQSETPYNGPGEAFYNPETKAEINDLHGGNIRMRENGESVILDPIQRLGVGADEHPRLSSIGPDAFKSQARTYHWSQSEAWTTPQAGTAGTGNVNPGINPSFAMSKSIPRTDSSSHGMADLFLHGKQPDQNTTVAFTGKAQSAMTPEGMKHTLPKPMSDGMSAGENNSNRAINQKSQGREAEQQRQPSEQPNQPSQEKNGPGFNTRINGMIDAGRRDIRQRQLGVQPQRNGQIEPAVEQREQPMSGTPSPRQIRKNQVNAPMRSWEERMIRDEHSAFRKKMDAMDQQQLQRQQDSDDAFLARVRGAFKR